MPSTVNPENYLQLVRPWNLERNLLLPLFSTSLLSSCILNMYPQSHRGVYVSFFVKESKKRLFFFPADGDHYRKTKWSKCRDQLMVGVGQPQRLHQQHIPSSLTSKAQGIPRKRRWKGCKSQKTRTSATRVCLSYMTVQPLNLSDMAT